MFITDPKDGKKSVSLTLLVVSFVALLVGCYMELAGKSKGLSGLQELFFTTAALYFSRRVSVKGTSFSVSQQNGNDAEGDIK